MTDAEIRELIEHAIARCTSIQNMARERQQSGFPPDGDFVAILSMFAWEAQCDLRNATNAMDLP